MRQLAGPEWDLSTEYKSPEDEEIARDLAMLTDLLNQIESKNKVLTPCLSSLDSLDEKTRTRVVNTAQEIYKLSDHASQYLANPATFASCILSVHSDNEAAKVLQGKLTNYRVRFTSLRHPLSQFLELADELQIDEFLADPEIEPAAWSIRHARLRKHELLDLSQESLVTGLAQNGFHAWGRLYTELSGKLRCKVMDGNEQKEVGIAEAASLMMSPRDRIREDAWSAINTAWTEHEDTCASALNALAGWRLEMCERRSTTQEVHFLDAPAHASHIEKDTLKALMQVAAEARPISQRAAKAMARAYSKSKFGPWDTRAPAPELPGTNSKFPFEVGLNIVADAYGEVDSSMGSFVRMMAANKWIEGTIGARKRPGAYCTSFQKSKSPRVYMTYSGSMSDITVLAHELGHAFHHWVMKDLPNSQRSYGMSLAETASTFGETLVRDALVEQAESPQQALTVVWEEMSAIVGFLLNIPTRFEFEKKLYEARASRPLLVNELRDLMSNAWREWYGDSLSQPDAGFWMSKLHFYISGISFYNFPYLFGYLFSQSIYQRRNEMSDSFFERYTGLLRDTGRMSAESLASRYLAGNLTQTSFWQHTVDQLEQRVFHFERLCDEVF